MSQLPAGSSLQQHIQHAAQLVAAGRFDQALAAYQRAATTWPQEPVLLLAYGMFCVSVGRGDLATPIFDRAVAVQPGNARLHYGRASALRLLNRMDEAHRSLDEAIRLMPEEPALPATKAELHVLAGETERAMALIEPHLGPAADHPTIAGVFAKLAIAAERGKEALAMVERCLAKPGLQRPTMSMLWFAAGDLLDGLKRHEEAIEAWRKGHEARGLKFEPAALSDAVDAMISAWTRERIASLPRAHHRADDIVFVVGMPRSGTTLVEQIIASHSQGFGAGELPTITMMARQVTKSMPAGLPMISDFSPLTEAWLNDRSAEYLATIRGKASGQRILVDKMPVNFVCLGLIQLMFPGARVVHTVRHPMDTCISCFAQRFTGFMPWAGDLGHLGFFYRQYVRVMKHWKRVLDLPMLELQYEEVVEDLDASARRLIDFVGLPWEETCLRFHETKRLAQTSSYAQVRQPLYRTSVARYRRYGSAVAPLRESLGDLVSD